MPETLTLNEAANWLRVSVDTIRRRVQSGELRGTIAGGSGGYVIAREDFVAWIRSNLHLTPPTFADIDFAALPGLWDVSDVGHALSLATPAVYARSNRGTIPSVRIGPFLRFPRDLEPWPVVDGGKT